MKSKTASKKKEPIDFHVYERQAQICKAFANPVRLVILDLVSKGEMQCSELQQALGITKANLSQHIAILRAAGVLQFRREGKQIFCSLAMPEVKQACQMVRKVLESQWKATRCLIDSKP